MIPNTGEKSPLLRPSEGKEENVVSIKIPDGLKGVGEKAASGFQDAREYIVQTYVSAKERTKQSPWIISIVCVFACLTVASAGIFSAITDFVTLSPVDALLKLYQVLFALVALVLEITLYVNIFGLRKIINTWFRFIETTLGRGLFQMLPGSLAVATWDNMSQWLPGLALMAIGSFNVFYGVYTAWKLRQVMEHMKELEREKQLEKRSPSGDLSMIDLMVKKFQAIDINGTGQLSKMDLQQACNELKIDLSSDDVDRVFNALDRKNKGHVDLTDFETWWFKSKGSGLFV